MRLTASDFYLYFQPEICETRVYLRAIKTDESEASPYAKVLMKLGVHFEKQHLTSFTGVLDLSEKSREQREDMTKSAVEKKESIIYQPAFRVLTKIGMDEVEIVGDADFLIHEDDGYVIRDVKLARRVNEKDHPHILRQLELYGWLFENTFGFPPKRLEVFSSKNECISIPYDGGKQALAELERIYKLKTSLDQPYSPVGWTKCNSCGFRNKCWKAAEESRDVAVVFGVDQNLARALRADGTLTYDQLLEKFNIVSLAEFKKNVGPKAKRVGKEAAKILTMAEALKSGREILITPPEIPKSENYVMLDLEGIPPQMDELQKIYLWGMQVYGSQSGPFLSATAECGQSGDEIGWKKFLENASQIFGEHGEVPFIHWHHYERTNIENYIERYGDPFRIADRILENMVDLLPIVRSSIALPLPSYGLKAVEKFIGFKRTQDEYGGDWAIAKYIEAIETEDPEQREKILDGILTYNREDLAATWAVFEWFKRKFDPSILGKTS